MISKSHHFTGGMHYHYNFNVPSPRNIVCNQLGRNGCSNSTPGRGRQPRKRQIADTKTTPGETPETWTSNTNQVADTWRVSTDTDEANSVAEVTEPTVGPRHVPDTLATAGGRSREPDLLPSLKEGVVVASKRAWRMVGHSALLPTELAERRALNGSSADQLERSWQRRSHGDNLASVASFRLTIRTANHIGCGGRRCWRERWLRDIESLPYHHPQCPQLLPASNTEPSDLGWEERVQTRGQIALPFFIEITHVACALACWCNTCHGQQGHRLGPLLLAYPPTQSYEAAQEFHSVSRCAVCLAPMRGHFTTGCWLVRACVM